MFSHKSLVVLIVAIYLIVESSCVCKESFAGIQSSNEQPTKGSSTKGSLEEGRSRSKKLHTKPLGIPHAINGFSFKLYNVLRRSHGNENLFYSPVGIVYAFSMLMLGASDKSELEVFHGLHLNESFATPEEAHRAFRGILKIIESNKDYDMDLANIILIHKNEKFLEEFTKRLGNFYKVAIGKVDFARNGRQVMKDVNAWVSNNTHHKIKDLLKGPLDPLTKMVILNAVYFNGKWKYAFDKEISGPSIFFNHGSKAAHVTFMHNTANYGYYEDKEKKYQLLEMKYIGDVSFIMLLPKEKKGLDDVLSNVPIHEILKPLNEEKVQISMPKISLQTEYDLKQVLPELGIKAIFGPGADLSGISGDKTLFVSTGIHKTMLDVNEEGTEAASATAIGVGTRNYQNTPVFNADHPFLFFIKNTKYNTIFFMGRVEAF